MEENALSKKQTYLFAFLATVVAVALRSAMLFFTIDTKSGFIKAEYLFFGGAILAIIALAAVLVFVFSYLSKSKSEWKEVKNPLFRFASAFLALVIIYDTFFNNANSGAADWQRTLEIILALVTSITFIVSALGEQISITPPALLSVVPVLYWFIRLIIVFTAFSSLATIPDNVFELCALCLMLIASLWYAKAVCLGIEGKQKAFIEPVMLTAAYVCFVTAIPRTVVMLSGSESLLHKTGLPVMTPIAAGIYFLVFALSNSLRNE